MKTRFRIFITASIVLTATLLLSGTVFADGETPAEVPAEVEVLQTDESPPLEPAGEVPAINEALPPEEAIAVDEPVGDPLVEEIPPVEEPVDEAQPEEYPIQVPDAEKLPAEEPLAEVTPAEEPLEGDIPESDLVEIPEQMAGENDLILVNAEGVPLDVANPEANAITSGSDPRWKVGTVWFSVAVVPGDCYTGTTVGLTCFLDPDPIQYAINLIAADATKKPTNGLIYVESTLYTNPVVINGTSANLSTIKGLVGLPDGLGVYPTIQNNVTISNLLTGFTLQGFNIIDGVVTFTNNTGALNLTDLYISNGNGGDGLVVTGHKGNVVLTRVKSSDNDGNGATIDNTAITTGSVTITNSAFDRNGDGLAGNGYEYGLNIVTNGALSINGISVSFNDGQGLTATGFSSLTILHTLLNNNLHGLGADLLTTKTGKTTIGHVYALSNWDTGIRLTTNGTAYATSIEASNNGGSGMEINTSGGIGTVTVIYCRFSNNTGGDGLSILSKNIISVSSIQSFQNGGYGVSIDNYFGGLGSGNVNVGIFSTTSNAMANSFSGNAGGDGLSIISKGSVTISDFHAQNNAGYGVYVRNDYGIGNITIQKSLVGWTNEVNFNAWDGIYLLTKGIVIVKNTNMSHNNGSGIYTGSTTKSIALSSINLFNNMWEGVYAQATGNIILVDVIANGNGWGGTFSGIKINNTFGTGSVTIQSPSLTSYRDFSNNTGSGIEINSKGLVQVKSVWANNNGEYGLYVDNHISTSTPGVSVLYGDYDHNGFDGLHIESKGNVLLTNIAARNNDSDWMDINYYSGAYIDNSYGTGVVTINSTSSAVRYEFNSNTAYGLEIVSKGVVSIGNIHATDNWDGGMVIDNSGSIVTAPRMVSVARSNFDNNGGDGLAIRTIGSVSLAYIHSSNNYAGGSGLVIDTYSLACLIPANVILGGTGNEFMNNEGNGVDIDTEGYVTLYNITTDWNGDNGIAIYNRYAGSSGAVTISANSGVWNSTSSNNWNGGTAGIVIETYGAVSITRLHSNDNDWMGGAILNTTTPGALVRAVSILSGSFCSNNGPYGLLIESMGAVAISYSNVDSNEENGLSITTSGSVTLNNVTTRNNSMHESTILYTDPSATIYEHLTSDVAGDIFWFEGANINYTITLESSRFDAYLELHDSFGSLIAWDDNGLGGNDAMITLLAGDLTALQDYYVLVTTASGWGEPGDYKLTFNGPGTTYTKGAYTGAFIDNSGGAANVTITNWSDFSGNNEDGLVILTNKEVRITNSHSGDNGGSGVIIPNGSKVLVENTSTSRILWFGNNGDYGVVAAGITGAITVTGKMEFNNNGDDGLVLINNLPGNTYGILVKSSTANDNGGYGIYALTNGHLLLTSLTANHNALSGASVDNSTGTGSLTLDGYNYFYNNGGNGFEASTKGVVVILRVTVEGNGATGIAVAASGVGKAVTLKSIISQFNFGDGVTVSATGILKLYSIRSWLNGGDGINTNSHAYSTTFDSCIAIGNAGDGIDATTPANLLIYPFTKYFLIPNTFYFGNDVDGSGDLDIRHTIV